MIAAHDYLAPFLSPRLPPLAIWPYQCIDAKLPKGKVQNLTLSMRLTGLGAETACCRNHDYALRFFAHGEQRDAMTVFEKRHLVTYRHGAHKHWQVHDVKKASYRPRMHVVQLIS